MSDVSRPATAEDLKRLVQALEAAGARYLLIGAYALLAHGYQRATVDIDLLVEATRDNGERGLKPSSWIVRKRNSGARRSSKPQPASAAAPEASSRRRDSIAIRRRRSPAAPARR